MQQALTGTGRSVATSVACLLVAFTWLCLLLAVLFLSEPAHNFVAMLFLGASGLVIGTTWLIFTVVKPQLLSSTSRRWWLTVPLAGGLGVVLLITNWGLALRIALCESTLHNHIAGLSAGSNVQRRPERIGLFRFEEVEEYQGSVYFYTGSGFLNRYGLAYIPPGQRPAPWMSVRHVYGPWYTFEWRF
jgi:hypothetical protein